MSNIEETIINDNDILRTTTDNRNVYNNLAILSNTNRLQNYPIINDNEFNEPNHEQFLNFNATNNNYNKDITLMDVDNSNQVDNSNSWFDNSSNHFDNSSSNHIDNYLNQIDNSFNHIDNYSNQIDNSQHIVYNINVNLNEKLLQDKDDIIKQNKILIGNLI